MSITRFAFIAISVALVVLVSMVAYEALSALSTAADGFATSGSTP